MVDMTISCDGNMDFFCDLLVFKNDNDYWYSYHFSMRGKHVKLLWCLEHVTEHMQKVLFPHCSNAKEKYETRLRLRLGKEWTEIVRWVKETEAVKEEKRTQLCGYSSVLRHKALNTSPWMVYQLGHPVPSPSPFSLLLFHLCYGEWR